MTCRVLPPGPRAISVSLWVSSLAWLVKQPRSSGVHRTLVGAAATYTVIAAVRANARDIAETIRLAVEAGRYQGRVDRDWDS